MSLNCSYYITPNYTMKFQLPDQIQMEVMSYDQTRKRLAKQQRDEEARRGNINRTKAAKYPKGNVISLGLIPDDIVSTREMQEAIDFINGTTIKNTISRFSYMEDPPAGQTRLHAVLYWTKQYWVAAWMPKRKDDGYLYGISVAFKDTETARKQMQTNERLFVNRKSGNKSLIDDPDLQMSKRKIGRTNWLVTTQFITQEEIEAGYTTNYIREVDMNHTIERYKERTQLHSEAIMELWRNIMAGVPQWDHIRYNNNDFIRMTKLGNSIKYVVNDCHIPCMTHETMCKFEHTNEFYHKVFSEYGEYDCIAPEFFNSPWFRRKVNKMVSDMSVAFEMADPIKASMKPIVAPLSDMHHYLQGVNEMYKAYPFCDINHLIANEHLLERVKFHMPTLNISEYAHRYLTENVPPERFINMLKQHHDYLIAERAKQNQDSYNHHYDEDDISGNPRMYWRHWADSMNMLNQVLRHNERTPENILPTEPKRYRINEWHDLLMSQTWKLRNPNEKLPQKLFPQPVKAESDMGTFTFFQPIDTHQVAEWGQAMRNCVGSGSYAEGVRKFRHIILLAMVDNKPRFTMQLTVDNGEINIDQCTTLRNGGQDYKLTADENTCLKTAFAKALQFREIQLR